MAESPVKEFKKEREDLREAGQDDKGRRKLTKWDDMLQKFKNNEIHNDTDLETVSHNVLVGILIHYEETHKRKTPGAISKIQSKTHDEVKTKVTYIYHKTKLKLTKNDTSLGKAGKQVKSAMETAEKRWKAMTRRSKHEKHLKSNENVACAEMQKTKNETKTAATLNDEQDDRPKSQHETKDDEDPKRNTNSSATWYNEDQTEKDQMPNSEAELKGKNPGNEHHEGKRESPNSDHTARHKDKVLGDSLSVEDVQHKRVNQEKSNLDRSKHESSHSYQTFGHEENTVHQHLTSDVTDSNKTKQDSERLNFQQEKGKSADELPESLQTDCARHKQPDDGQSESKDEKVEERSKNRSERGTSRVFEPPKVENSSNTTTRTGEYKDPGDESLDQCKTRRSSYIDIERIEDIVSEEQISQLSNRQLKKILVKNKMDCHSILEKKDLVAEVTRLWEHTLNTELPEETCTICLTSNINCVFLECGHSAACIECGQKIKECPICRSYVVRIVRIFR